MKDKREELADYAHRAWSGWMKYMFTKGTNLDTKEGQAYIIQASLVERWTRQMNTDYKDLPESEKASDRKEADEMLKIMEETK